MVLFYLRGLWQAHGDSCNTACNVVLSYFGSNGRVRSMILNVQNESWQPFDPRKKRVLKKVIELSNAMYAEFDK